MKRQTLIVKSVPRTSVQGRSLHTSNYGNTSVPLNKTKASGVYEPFFFSRYSNVPKYATGGDEQVLNEFDRFTKGSELREAYRLDNTWSDEELDKIVASEKISRQSYYEILDGQPKNFYTNVTKTSLFTAKAKDVQNRPEPTFIEKFSIILYDGENYFYSDTPRGRWAIQLLKHHPLVAKDKDSINSSKHHFYIALENEEALEQENRLKLKEDVIFQWSLLQREANEFQIYQVASLLKDAGSNIVQGQMASEEVKRKVRMYLDKSSENLRAFAKVAELTKDVPGLKKLEVKYLIQQARNIDLIQVRNNKVIWVTRDSDDVNREFKSLEELEKFFLKEQAAFKKGSNDLNFYSILQTELQERNIKLK